MPPGEPAVRYRSSVTENGVIPARLGRAVATDRPTTVIYEGKDGVGMWHPDVIPVEGPQGIKGFKPSRDHHLTSVQPGDPKWRAPKGARLSFKVYSRDPATFEVYGGDHWRQEMKLPGSERWQTVDNFASLAVEKRFDRWRDIVAAIVASNLRVEVRDQLLVFPDRRGRSLICRPGRLEVVE